MQQHSHEAIVDKETWALAQKIMDERGKNFCRKRPTYAFTGLIECECCGKSFVH